MKYEFKSSHQQKGLFATTYIKEGEIIYYFEGEFLSSPNRLSIEISKAKHLYNGENDNKFYINHSCEPNCKVDTNNLSLIALKDIHIGKELTFDYNTTESRISHPFTCWCQSENCQKNITGKQSD